MSTLQLCLQIFLLASVFVFRPSQGQSYGTGCAAQLQDIPNPSSDTCTAFFRCFNFRQYSIRCPLGQAFHFDSARCRQETEVDCPLQLQRFQAPAVPSHLRSPQAQQEREVEIRVVHVAPGVDPNNLQFFNNGRPVTISRQDTAQRGGHTLIASQQQQQQGGQPLNVQQQQQGGQPLNVQQTPVLFRTPDGQLVQGQTFIPVQGQVIQGQVVQGQPGQGMVIQSQPAQGQPGQGQIIQNQPGQGQIIPNQPVQGQVPQSQAASGQPAQGFFVQQSAQTPVQLQG